MQIDITKETLKKQVQRLRATLLEAKTVIGQSTAYHLLSIVYGFKNWNTLSAMLKREEELKPIENMDSEGITDDNKSQGV